MSQQKHPNVVNWRDVEPRAVSKGRKFGFRAARMGSVAGGKQLGCSLLEVEPGRQAFPHHFHCANEEAIFVLEGEGELRLGEQRVKLEAGDYVAMPCGPDHAHSLRNTGATPLRYLCFSTLVPTEVVGYPDSKKFGAVGSADVSKGMLSSPHWVMKLFKDTPNVDYYEGEAID